MIVPVVVVRMVSGGRSALTGRVGRHSTARLAALAVAEGPARWASRVAALRPDLTADLSRALLTTWNDDPWAGESYSARPWAEAASLASTPPEPGPA